MRWQTLDRFRVCHRPDSPVITGLAEQIVNFHASRFRRARFLRAHNNRPKNDYRLRMMEHAVLPVLRDAGVPNTGGEVNSEES